MTPGVPQSQEIAEFEKKCKNDEFFQLQFFPPNHQISLTNGLNRIDYGQNRVNEPKNS